MRQFRPLIRQAAAQPPRRYLPQQVIRQRQQQLHARLFQLKERLAHQ